METVCHVITKLELGGAQEVALYAVSHLDPGRFRPLLVAGSGGILTDEARSLPGVEVHILSSLARRVHALADVVALVELIRLFRRLRPTIVHTHSSKAGILGRWAARCAGVPVIIHTIHGYGITPAQPAWLRRILILVERMTGWITTHWIAVAQVDVERGIAWKLFKRAQVSVIRPGIDPRPFQSVIEATTRQAVRAEFGVGPGDYLVGTVACLKPQKAPEDFVAVAKRVCDAVPDARFVLIGDGELRSRIESLIAQNGLSHRLCLAGWRRDVPAVMNAFDAFLLTSHWEGLPRVVLEARTIGLPIVATNVGGIGEAVIQGRHGWLSSAGDIASLSEQLIRLSKRRNSQPQSRLQSGEPLPQEFHLEEMVKQYESLYDNLLANRRGSVPPRSTYSASHP